MHRVAAIVAVVALAALAYADKAPAPLRITARNFGPHKFGHVLKRESIAKIFPKATIEKAEPPCVVDHDGRKICTAHWAFKVTDASGLEVYVTDFDLDVQAGNVEYYNVALGSDGKALANAPKAARADLDCEADDRKDVWCTRFDVSLRFEGCERTVGAVKIADVAGCTLKQIVWRPCGMGGGGGCKP